MTKRFPTVDQYKTALLKLESEIHPKHLEMLQVHFNSPCQITTTKSLAQAVGYKSFRAVNLQYGKLGRNIGRAMGRFYKGPKDISTIVAFVKPGAVSNREWLLVMRPELAKALEELQWV